MHRVGFANLSCSSDQDAPQFAMGVFVDVSELEMWETFRLKCRRSFGPNYEKVSCQKSTVMKCNSDYWIVAFLSKETKCEQCYRLSITASFCIFLLSASCQLMSAFEMSQMPSCIYSVACVSWDCGHLFSFLTLVHAFSCCRCVNIASSTFEIHENPVREGILRMHEVRCMRHNLQYREAVRKLPKVEDLQSPSLWQADKRNTQ